MNAAGAALSTTRGRTFHSEHGRFPDELDRKLDLDRAADHSVAFFVQEIGTPFAIRVCKRSNCFSIARAIERTFDSAAEKFL